MKKVAKLLIINPTDHYLLLHRSNHPIFGVDPDLPGGTLEHGESILEAMLREVKEEVGMNIIAEDIAVVYSGSNYSAHGTHYSLFVATLEAHPAVQLSWEHTSYEWLDRNQFLQKVKNARDTYMHMVYAVISSRN